MRTRSSSWGYRALLIAVLAAGLVSARVVLANSTAPAPPAQAAAARPALPACTIVGTNGPDTIVGTPGDDVICAKGGDDVVRGGGGNDVIFGSRGRDTLFGGPGDDKLYGGEGNDRLYGGGGRDFLQGGHGSDLISGGAGRDTVDYALRVGPVRVALGGSARNGAPGERDVIASDVENVLGGKAADVLIGDGRANALHGNGGADVLKGRGGNDALFGDRGNDRLTGGRGDDRLFGGRGRDRLDARDARRFLDRLNCGGGRADTALADAPDRVSRNCERVHRGRARNHAPTNIVLSKHSVAENQPVGTTVGRLSAVDRDRGDRHTFALVSGAGSADNASFRIDGSRLVTKAVFDFESKHSYSVRIRVTDRRGRSFAKSFTISVTDLPENHAPAAASKLLTGVTEDGSKSIELSGSDPDGDALTFHVAQPAHGHVDTTTPAASCAGSACTATVVYTPDANYNGPDGFSYKVNDGTSDSAVATVAVTIDPVNDAPVATDTDVNVQERTATPVDLGAVVSDVETSDADLTYTIVSQPGHGTLIVSGPTLTYTPNGGFNGSDSFTYNVTDRGDPDNCSGSPPACDGPKTSPTRTVSLAVAPVNDTPEARDATKHVSEDHALAVDLTTLASDTETSATNLNYTIVDGPAHGSLTGSGPNQTYTPNANFNGTDQFTYEVTDRGDPDNCGPAGPGCAAAKTSTAGTVAIVVDPVNDAPTATDASLSTDEGTPAPVDLGALVSDLETSDANLIYTIVSGPSHGHLTGSGTSRTYTPDPNFNGSDSFTYKVTDRGDPDGCSGGPPGCDAPLSSQTQTVSITVPPVNAAPVAGPGSVSATEDTPKAIDLSNFASDVETSPANLTYEVVDGPLHGTLAGSGASLTYTPNPNYNGPDQLTYQVTDRGDPDNCGPAGPGCAAAKTSSVGTVAITVAPVNDTPTASDTSLSTDEDTSASIDLAPLVSDMETSDAELTYEIVSGPAHGQLTANGTSQTYTPDASFNGTDQFTYRVTDRGDPDNCGAPGAGCDGPKSSATRTVSITVAAVNSPPVAGNGTATTDEDAATGIDLTGLAADVETGAANLTYTITGPPGHGQLTGSGGSRTYTPDANYNGLDSFTYTVTDRGDPDNCSPGPGCSAPLTSSTGTVSIIVNPVNDTPTADVGSMELNEDTSAPVDLGALAFDVETADANLTYQIVSGPTHGQLVGMGPTPTYTPDANYNGPDSFSYRVTDRGDPDNCGTPGPGCDAPQTSATKTVSITVDPVNDAPVAGNGSASANEDAATAIDLTAFAADLETSPANLTYTITSQPGHGTLTGSGASRTYTPDPNYNGPDQFSYTVTDRGDPDSCGAAGPGCSAPLTSSTGTVSVTVNPVNDAPVNTLPAGPLTAVQDTNTAITGASILDIDASTDDVQLTLSATHGTLTVSTSVLGGVGVLQVQNNATKTVVVTASQLAINTTLADGNGLVYHSDAAYTGPDTVTFTANDLGHNGSGGPLSDTDTLAVTVVPPNQPPVASGQSISTNEDTAKAITLSASDADGDDPLSFAIATQPTHGTLGAIGAVSCDHATPNTCTASVTYTPAPNYNGADSFTFTANDGRADSSPATVGITVNPVDDAPALANIESGALPYTENDPATAITATTTVSDIDSPNFDTGTLTVDYSAGGTVDDRLEIQDQGTGAGDIGVSGSSVTYGGTPIGTFAGGGGTSPLVLTLNANATPTSTQALVRAITYRNVSDNPTASRTVRFVLTDGDGGTSNAATRQISVTAVNDPPVVAGIESPAVDYVESVDSPPSQSQITNNLTLSDPDNANLAGATAQITSGCQSGEDSLVFTNQNGITGTYTGATCVLTLTGSSSVANYQAALRSIKYQDSSDTPNTTTRTITFQADDGQGANHASNTQSRDVTVTPANDSPAAAADVFNGTNSALAGVTLAVSTSPSTANVAVTGSLLSNDTDPDTPHANLTASAGTSSANGGVVAVNADGSFSYTPAPGFTGTDTFTYTTHDNGSPDRTSTATVTINVAGPHVWFVNPGGAAGGNGTSLSPFASLGPLSTSGDPDVAGDVIFVYQGTGNATSSGFTLEGNQRLVGQPQGLSVTNANGTYNLVTAGGANPTITNSSGAGLTLADGDTIQRVDVKNSSGVGVTGNAIGTLTYGANSTISGNAGGGLALSGAAGGAIDVGADISSSAGRSVSIANRNSGTTSLTGAVSDTGAGILLSSNTGATISFTGALSASTGASDAFTATGGGTINVSTGATRNLTTTTGTALTLNGVGGAIGLTDLDKNGAGTGISVTAASASVTVASGATIANTTTAGVTIDQGTGAFTYAGTITNSSGRAVQVTNRNAGAPGLVQFTGSITSTGGTGVNLDNNDNGTITFSGGLVLSTGATTAFNATNGGTVNVDNTSVVNTLTTTTGTALNVTNTTIGATGLKFQAISSNGAPNGINLSNTGAGAFTVTGNGSTCTIATPTCDGGSIQSSTGQGILLNKVGSVSLTRMKIQNSGTNSVGTPAAPAFPASPDVCSGACINGFTLDNSIITDSAGAAADDGLVLTNVTSAVSITNGAIANIPHNGIKVDNFNYNMTSFTMTGTTVSCASGQPCQPSGSLGNDGLLFSMRGTSVLTSGSISGSTFTGMRATGAQILTNDTGRIGNASGGAIVAPVASNSFTVQSNTFTGNNIGVDISQSQQSSEAFQILSNNIVGRLTPPNATSIQASSSAINTFTAAGADTGPTSHFHVGKIDGNSIGTQGVKDSGSGFGNGIRAVVQGQNTQGSITISNNTIREVPNAGNGIISLFGQDGAATTTSSNAKFKVVNNVIPANSGTNLSLGCGGPCTDMGIFALADEDMPVCTVMTGNNIYDVTTGPGGVADIYFAERSGPPAGAQLTAEGTGGSNSAYLQATNTLAGTSKFIDEGSNTSQVPPGTCGAFPS